MDSYIPQNLDQPTRYIVFTGDELAVVVIPLMALTVTINFMVGLLVGGLGLWLLRKFKQNNSLHRMKWAAYYALPVYIFRFKATPASHNRELVG